MDAKTASEAIQWTGRAETAVFFFKLEWDRLEGAVGSLLGMGDGCAVQRVEGGAVCVSVACREKEAKGLICGVEPFD
jgi:hypothetical protein